MVLYCKSTCTDLDTEHGL